MITTEATRRALTYLHGLVTLEQALTPDQCAEGRAAVEAARMELERVDASLEALGPIGEIRHVYAEQPTKVGMKLTQSTQGVSLEADVDRNRRFGETDEDAVKAAADLMSLAYRSGEARAVELGLTIGKAPKA